MKEQKVPKSSKIKKLLPTWDEDTGLLKHNSRIVGCKPTILAKDLNNAKDLNEATDLKGAK